MMEMLDVPDIIVKYFIEKALDSVYESLKKFRSEVAYPPLSDIDRNSSENPPELPSVCLLGLGRCGSNIAVGVSALVFEATHKWSERVIETEKSNESERTSENDKVGTDNSQSPTEENSLDSIRKWLLGKFPSQKQSQNEKPLFLVEPIVIVGDLDKDIRDRITFSTQFQERLEKEYKRLVILDFEEIHTGGCGNVPLLGQYLAKLILLRKAGDFQAANWKHQHSYLIDSAGLQENHSRLFFYIFSAGGGTGSGMASEFAAAQQYAYYNHIMGGTQTSKADSSSQQSPNKSIQSTPRNSSVFEPIFSCGISILPHGTTDSISNFEANHTNAGRMLCRYLSDEWKVTLQPPLDYNQKSLLTDNVRPFNCLMLVSNDIMQHSGNARQDQAIDTAKMESLANQYVSQQIFNILTAQAPTADYNTDYFKAAGIDIGETIKLDSNDLYMSLAGPVAVAYAESPAKGQQIDITEMLLKSIELPHINQQTISIEGLSILPEKADKYIERLERARASKTPLSEMASLNLFKRCSSTITIVSLPKDVKLPYSELTALKAGMNSLFPNTKLKRYALVTGASKAVSLTIIIAMSAVLCDEATRLITGYIKRSFGKTEYQSTDKIENEVTAFIVRKEESEESLREFLYEFENPSVVLVANWERTAVGYEQKFRELIGEENHSFPINSLLLTDKQVFDALRYLRHAIRQIQPLVAQTSLSDIDPEF